LGWRAPSATDTPLSLDLAATADRRWDAIEHEVA
jgi:hypothetical protein